MKMPNKKLNDGVEIPVLGLGTWQQEGKKCIEVVKNAIEIGYRHIDTAYAYYNQDMVAEGIKGFPREKLFITTKLWKDHLYPNKVEFACDECLKQLKTDYIDLFLVHWPDNYRKMVEIVEEMHKLKEKKKIRSVGVSNYTIHHIQDLLDKNVKVSVNQVEFHPYLYQKELLEFCNKHDIAVTAYSPIIHGKAIKDPVLIEIGKKYNKSPTQVSLRWLIQKGLIVIPKATSKEHLKSNFEIFDFKLDEDDIKKIDVNSKEKEERTIIPKFQEFDY